MKKNNIGSKTSQQDMPRERLLKYGAHALADYELLAILLKTGLPGKSVLSLAQDVLKLRGGLVGLLVSDSESLRKIKGLGNAKIAEILAVTELARRFIQAELSTSEWVFASSEQVREFLLIHFKGLAEEQFGMILLDQQHRFLGFEILARGEVSTVGIPMRKLISNVLRYRAAAVVLVHNHPAHSRISSLEDKQATRSIEQGLTMVDVRMLDHFIVAGNSLISMKEEGGW
ncbi:MAG: hypothetical protein CSA10_00190 [Cardiobacteriales bacterium]|nr:MAG: hypothetical protein CSA10_00190 [Cardiobacteriales bacterium]